MNNYFDPYGRIHDRPATETNPVPSNNGWIYTAYLQKLGYKVDLMSLFVCFQNCKNISDDGRVVLVRSPGKELPPISRDEILGMAALGFLRERHIPSWSFSPYKIPPFKFSVLIKQVREVMGEHRNYFWKNNLDQIYRFAFSVPIADRAFILECFGEKNTLRYFFYKVIAKVDQLLTKPENGIHWLKYGGEENKKAMRQEFPEDHLLRQL